MAIQLFGSIPGIKIGASFPDRKSLSSAGIHRTLMSGIDGNGKEGASSIVLNGGYIDDQDLGDEIIYTGHGGNNPTTGRQNADQSWDAPGNKGLVVSEIMGLPVRVTRGYKHNSKFSPKQGFSYAGLFRVTDHKEDTGKDGYKICRFRLEKLKEDVKPAEIPEIQLPAGNRKEQRVQTTITRIIRDTVLSQSLKKLHDYTCQVCGIRIEVRGIPYAEGAHIRPLGKPHGGHDVPGNILCLCPNHHVMFDKGGFTVEDDLALIGLDGVLETHKNHELELDNLRYHKEHIYIND